MKDLIILIIIVAFTIGVFMSPLIYRSFVNDTSCEKRCYPKIMVRCVGFDDGSIYAICADKTMVPVKTKRD